MARWDDVARDAPELSTRVRAAMDAHLHKTLATLRRDGSPRISGTEVTFLDGELWLGMMDASVKARDLHRDPRFALHSATVDPEMVEGDAKIAGRAVEVTDPQTIERFGQEHAARTGQETLEPFHLFRLDVDEIVSTRIGDPPDHLVIETWRAGAGTRRIERR